MLLFAATPLAHAQQRSVTWSRYDVDIDVRSDGTMRMSETQTINFQGTYQQGFRVIPTDQVTSIDETSVAEIVNNQTVPYRPTSSQATNGYRTTNTEDGLRIEWWFPPTTNGTRTFVVSYTVHGGIRIYDSGDQVFWKAIYADRPGDVAASTVTVHVPADVPSSELRTSFYRYTQDQLSQLWALPSSGSGSQVDARTVQFNVGQLPSGTGAEVRVQFPHGIVPPVPPPWQAEADRAEQLRQVAAPIAAFLSLLFTVLRLAGGGAALFLLWYTRGRDPARGAVPPRLDQPPSDLPAPLAGTLV
ncbi:MAG TPA: DUF2207 domain-containing protein, partial [Chloroflexota bacterium]|nr:DUF2207 domain-containing protein [Chloroflexota bacterium]